MGELLVGAVVGFVAARGVWLAARPWFDQPVLRRSNYRGVTLPTAAGMVLPLALFLAEAGRRVADAGGVGDDPVVSAGRVVTLLAVAGFCLLGTIDDLLGAGDDRGFRGHLRALTAGRVTTGMIKLLGGGAVALVAVATAATTPAGHRGGVLRLLADAALVALAANLGNLLDRRPGRTIKGGLLAFALLVVATGADPRLAGVAVLVGAAAALLLDDLRERLMLGDAGANPLGAALGLGVVLTAGPGVRTLVLLGLLLFNLLGEVVSFTRVIEAVPPLRALDALGRRSPP